MVYDEGAWARSVKNKKKFNGTEMRNNMLYV
jgi:hypothetical protein